MTAKFDSRMIGLLVPTDGKVPNKPSHNYLTTDMDLFARSDCPACGWMFIYGDDDDMAGTPVTKKQLSRLRIVAGDWMAGE